jgi:hypothetical protein
MCIRVRYTPINQDDNDVKPLSIMFEILQTWDESLALLFLRHYAHTLYMKGYKTGGPTERVDAIPAKMDMQ